MHDEVHKTDHFGGAEGTAHKALSEVVMHEDERASKLEAIHCTALWDEVELQRCRTRS